MKKNKTMLRNVSRRPSNLIDDQDVLQFLRPFDIINHKAVRDNNFPSFYWNKCSNFIKSSNVYPMACKKLDLSRVIFVEILVLGGYRNDHYSSYFPMRERASSSGKLGFSGTPPNFHGKEHACL